jgi:hypothetical protein
MTIVTFTPGKKYHVEYRFWNKKHDFAGVYEGIKESTVQGIPTHTFDLGGGARFHIGEKRITEVEEV